MGGASLEDVYAGKLGQAVGQQIVPPVADGHGADFTLNAHIGDVLG